MSEFTFTYDYSQVFIDLAAPEPLSEEEAAALALIAERASREIDNRLTALFLYGQPRPEPLVRGHIGWNIYAECVT